MTKKHLWRAGLAIAVVGAASVAAIGIASASDNPVRPAAQQTSDDDHGWRGPWGGGPGRGPWGGGGLGNVLGSDISDFLHAEAVLAKEGGGTQTVLVQKGAVTEVSGTRVTVKSADGFTTSYTVNDDTKVRADSDDIGAVAKDEEVVVVAPKSGDTHTATVVVDLTDLGWK
jgi:hypothetical protein